MKIERLFAILFLLLGRKKVSAQQLADRFEVSIRTIYRDVDTLSAAGIPIYADRGRNGGICIMDHFILNKSLLSVEEQQQILVSLKTLQFVEADVQHTRDKLSDFFARDEENWLSVDLDNWGETKEEKALFPLLKEATQKQQLLSFTYYGANGEQSCREVEPYQIMYKGQDWYVYAYCLKRLAYRYFKLSRMREVQCMDISFTRRNDVQPQAMSYAVKKIKVLLKVDKQKAFRVLDEMRTSIIKADDTAYLVEVAMEEQWLYQYLMTYNDSIEVISPPAVRAKMIEMIKKMQNKYNI